MAMFKIPSTSPVVDDHWVQGICLVNVTTGEPINNIGGAETYATYADFPATGSSGTIYIALDTTKLYIWDGSQYVQVASSSSLVYKGVIDISTAPNYPAGVIGDYYKAVNTNATYPRSGFIGGASGKQLQTTNIILCNEDNAGGDEAAVGDKWSIINDLPAFEYNDETEGGAGLLSSVFFSKLLWSSSLSVASDQNVLPDGSTVQGGNLSSITVSGGGGAGTITYGNAYMMRIKDPRAISYLKYVDGVIILPNVVSSFQQSINSDKDIYVVQNHESSTLSLFVVAQGFKFDTSTGLPTATPVDLRTQASGATTSIELTPNTSVTMRWSHSRQRFEEQ